MAVSIAQKRADFHKLHESGCFVIPNPWDVGGARALASLGFKAIASTSAGFAWSTGRPDYAVTLEDVLAHLTELSAAVDLPVNADFEGGFAIDPADVAVNVTRAVATGIAGLSIEDSTLNKDAPLFARDLAIERIRAARGAIDANNSGALLVGRCEAFLYGSTDLPAVIDRLNAYAEAGAHCLYAPGVKKKEDIATLVKEVAPRPVNILIASPGMSVAEAADLGVRRISVGGALAVAAWAGMMKAARELAEQGTFGGFSEGMPKPGLNKIFQPG